MGHWLCVALMGIQFAVIIPRLKLLRILVAQLALRRAAEMRCPHGMVRQLQPYTRPLAKFVVRQVVLRPD